MRRLALLLLLSTAAPVDAWAEDPCVDVTIGAERSYACINQQLQRAVPARRIGPEAEFPNAGDVPSNAAGTFNQAATAEQLGSSFGNSVRPQRPPPAVYPAPLTRAR